MNSLFKLYCRRLRKVKVTAGHQGRGLGFAGDDKEFLFGMEIKLPEPGLEH